jgi:Bacterial regulatory protein, Fis family
MKPQIPLEQILRVWVTPPNAMVASRRLGISRRTLYYRIEKASLMELRDAYAQLQVDTHAQLA